MAKGVDTTMAIRKLMVPVKPISMARGPPSRPARTPRGMPKFSPQPEWIMGTIASTSTAFQLKRLMTLVIWVGRSDPVMGAIMNKKRRKPAMISRG